MSFTSMRTNFALNTKRFTFDVVQMLFRC